MLDYPYFFRRNFGCGWQVLLATYEEYRLPEGVQRLDAALYLPKNQLEKLQELNVRIVHIADAWPS